MIEQNTNRLWFAVGSIIVGSLLIGGVRVLAQESILPMTKISQAFVKMTEPDEKMQEIQGLIAEGYIPVATADELNNVRNDTERTYGKGTEWEDEYTGGLDKKYIQVANIDLSGYSVEGWNPIGTDSANSFTGTYDGGNYVITDLEVNGEGENFQGLFGVTQRATISNVGLIENKVTGASFVGGLVGYADNSEISNSYATGEVTGSGERVGGLVGYTCFTNIENSYTTGEVTGSGERVGGLVGYAENKSTISNSYATGSIKGSERRVGGLVGEANCRRSYELTIINSYATGPVTGAGEVGGLVGSANGTNTYRLTITNSYATGKVTGRQNNVGGLVGFASNSYTSNSYSNRETTGQPTGTGIGKTTNEMKQQTTYEGWDFDTIWAIQEGVSYPTLINNPERH